LQNDINNRLSGENVDIFDFFNDGMCIDKENTFKLASKYVDDDIEVNYTDYNGNTEFIRCRSALVLVPVEFNLNVKRLHLSLADIAQRYAQNGTDWRIYNVWRELRKLNT
jgi:hypothetical protein